MKSYFNWSGGKDSALALYKTKQAGVHVDLLLTSVNSVYNRVSMHGVRRELLVEQAQSLAIKLAFLDLPEMPDMTVYESLLCEKVSILKNQGFTNSIFGDIFLEDLKLYRENQLAPFGIDCQFPLWKCNTSTLLQEFLDLGFKAIIVCVNEEYLDKSFCGRVLDQKFIEDLPPNVDPCGENGEFHTFVFDGPIYNNKIDFTIGELTRKKYTAPKDFDNCFSEINQPDYGFYFIDLLPISLV